MDTQPVPLGRGGASALPKLTENDPEKHERPVHYAGRSWGRHSQGWKFHGSERAYRWLVVKQVLVKALECTTYFYLAKRVFLD